MPAHFNSANRPVNIGEVYENGRKHGFVAAAATGFRQIHVGQLLDFGLRRAVLVLGTERVKNWVADEGGVSAFEPKETRVLAGGSARYEVELFPQAVEFALSGLVKNQVIQWPVVAEIAGHAMKAGIQEPPRTALLLFGIGISPGTLRDIKRIGKSSAKAFERRLIVPPFFRIGWRRERSNSLGARGQSFRHDLQSAAGVTHSVPDKLAILPQDQCLRAFLHPGTAQVLDFRHQLLANPNDKIAHLHAAIAHVREVRLRPGQLTPNGLGRGHGSDCVGVFSQQGPNPCKVFRADFRGGSGFRKRCLRFAERSAVEMAPRREKVFGQVGGLPFIEVDDPANAVLVAVRIGHHRKRRKAQAIRLQHGMIGYKPGLFQVLLHQCR